MTSPTSRLMPRKNIAHKSTRCRLFHTSGNPVNSWAIVPRGLVALGIEATPPARRSGPDARAGASGGRCHQPRVHAGNQGFPTAPRDAHGARAMAAGSPDTPGAPRAGEYRASDSGSRRLRGRLRVGLRRTTHGAHGPVHRPCSSALFIGMPPWLNRGSRAPIAGASDEEP